ncbi:MAG: amidinotransferase, partial [Candidatus Saccharimonadales bacterium]
AIIKPDLIAYCPAAFIPQSRQILAELPINKIIVARQEATNGFACNLVSTGETVIMSSHAPNFQSDLEKYGLKTVTPEVSELQKGGGFIRCTSLTLDNV